MRMKDRQNSTALRRDPAVRMMRGACRKVPPPPAPAPARAGEADKVLADVVDPWTWPRAAGASDRERAIEDIGPYERGARGRCRRRRW